MQQLLLLTKFGEESAAGPIDVFRRSTAEGRPDQPEHHARRSTVITASGRVNNATTSEDGADELVSALLTASRALVGVSARSLARVEDAVTITQFRTLVVLEGHGDTRLNQLAERLAVTPSTALRMVDRLIAAHLVTRQENKADRREVLIGLTREGTRLVREVTERRRAEIATIVAAMPQDGRQEVVAALNAFAQAAGEATPSADTAARLGW
jgi:DNA-binding MarR family transcriptional regulator